MKKKTVGTIVLGLLFFGFFVKAGIPQPEPTAVVELQNSTNAHVFVKALYPNGFRSLGVYTVGKDGRICIKLGSLKKAWNEEYRKSGRLAQPLIVLTIVKDGKIAIESLNLNRDKTFQSVKVTPRFKPLNATSVKNEAKTQNSGGIQPLAGYYQWIDDSYNWRAPTIVAQVTPDSTTKGYISYSYSINKKVGFSVDIFVDSDWTRLASYNIVQKDESGSYYKNFPKGQDYYIWMDFEYRWERWGIHCDGQTFYEEYVYILDFYPKTLTGGTSKPPNAQIPPVDEWIYEGTYTSTGEEGYYAFHISNLGRNDFAVDALKFIEALEVAGKISSAAAQKASLTGLFIDVGFKYDNMLAFDFDLSLDSDVYATHDVWRTKSTDMDTVPVLYFDVD